jgi:transposase
MGCNDINSHIAFEERDDTITYFYGAHPVFTHHKDDLCSFRMYASQLIVNGSVTGAQVQRAFGLSPVTVKRYVRQFREKGINSFFAPKVHRGATVLTADVLKKAQELFDEGLSRNEVSEKLGVKSDTIRKAIAAKKLHVNEQLKKTL